MSTRRCLSRRRSTALALRPGGLYVDATFGRGGHSARILEALGRRGPLVAIDRDPAAIAAGRARFAHETAACTSCTASSPSSPTLVRAQTARTHCDGILFDLGVSSPQLDDAARGFSFSQDGPLDMRMDPTRGQPVSAWLAHAGVDEIRHVIATLGEERFARRIAARDRARARRTQPLDTHRASSPRWWRARCARASRASIRRRAPFRRCACTSTTSSGSSQRGLDAGAATCSRPAAGSRSSAFIRSKTAWSSNSCAATREVDPVLAGLPRCRRRRRGRRCKLHRPQAAARAGGTRAQSARAQRACCASRSDCA